MTVEYVSAVLETHSHTNFMVEVFQRTLQHEFEDINVEESTKLSPTEGMAPSHPISTQRGESEKRVEQNFQQTNDERYGFEGKRRFKITPARMARICSASDLPGIFASESWGWKR